MLLAPLLRGLQKFMDVLSKHKTVVLEGETGSGKTTQVTAR